VRWLGSKDKGKALNALNASRSDSGDSASASSLSSVPALLVPVVFGDLERVVTDRAKESGWIPEESGWELVEDCWVLPSGTKDKPEDPKAIVHFIGGAFAGASPQLTYRYLLEQLASRGFFVIATPFETNFEHLRIADDVHLRYTQCVKALGTRVEGLQTFGVGHSLGALEQLLLCSRYKDVNVNRAGNVMISFNNKPVTDAIPFYFELISPASSQIISPLLKQLGSSPQAKLVENVVGSLRDQTPEFIRTNVFPLIDQLQPIYEDIAQDRVEFTPTPEESRAYIEKRYTCSRNLLVKFSNDTIDETSTLTETLQKTLASMPLGSGGSTNNNKAGEGSGGKGKGRGAVSMDSGLELTVKQLSGDHITPCKQPPALVEEQVSQISEQSKDFFGSMASIAEMATGFGANSNTGVNDGVNSVASAVQKGIDQFTSDFNTNLMAASEIKQVDELVNVITQWSGIEPRVTRRLPQPED
jgi:hypothetical protein